MKVRRAWIILLVLALTSLTALPQDRVEEIKVEWQCNYYGETPEEKIYTFSSDLEAEAAIDKILRQIGLARNFTIKAADVPNAAAVIIRSGGRPVRYILYSQAFIRRVKNVTRTDWAALSIMAHELGHHLQGHTLEPGGSRPPLELEADEFSGFVLYRMGATLEQAQAAMTAFASDRGSATHPGKRARLAAIESGYTRARDVSRGNTTTEPSSAPTRTSDPPALQTIMTSVWLDHTFLNEDKQPALVKFEKGGRVRGMTPSNRVGYVPTNVSWYFSEDTLNYLHMDPYKETLQYECKGTLKGTRIEGKCKDLTTDSSSPWLLTKFIQ